MQSDKARINEIIELLVPLWEKEPNLNLTELLLRFAKDSGFNGQLEQFTDDMLFYQLKVVNSNNNEQIPGLQKDYEDDFKTAILKARGLK